MSLGINLSSLLKYFCRPSYIYLQVSGPVFTGAGLTVTNNSTNIIATVHHNGGMARTIIYVAVVQINHNSDS